MLITRDAYLADRVKVAFDGTLVVSSSWAAHDRLPWDLLIVDLSGLSSSAWQHMERWSRQHVRPTVILIDDECTPRQRLARVVAEALIPSDSDDRDLTEGIVEHMWEHAFRVAAHHIGFDAGIQYPLAQFLAAAFTARCRKVSTLALSLGFSMSTVRNQWRSHRSDPSLRLEDVLHRIHDIRELARRGRGDTWHSELQALADSIRSPCTYQ